jgi:hypothetical protein
LISRKVTGGQEAYGFVFSEELKNRNLNNNQFLTIIYRAFFNRLADKSIFLLFFLSDVGRYRISPFPRPKRLKLEINVIIEIRVVPIPTCSAEYRRAFIIQKKKPNTAITPVLNIR